MTLAAQAQARPTRVSSFAWLLAVALLGAVAWLALLLALHTVNPLEVMIGRSMQPTLHAGDLAIMRGVLPAQLRLGDVVAVTVDEGSRERYAYPEHVLHRVIGITLNEGVLLVQTKGDAESEPDPFLTPASAVSRRLAYDLPRAGFVLLSLRSTEGRIALVALAVLFLAYRGVRRLADSAEEHTQRGVEGVVVGLQQLSGAVSEYGEHLRSHTRILQQLGATTEDLHAATSLQREVIQDLSTAVQTLARAAGAAGRGAPAAPAPLAGRDHAASPRPTLDLVRVAPGRVWLRVQGLSSPRAVLEFGAALEADPLAGAVALERDADGAPVFAIETVAVDVLLRRIWRLHGPGDLQHAGAHDAPEAPHASIPPDDE